MHLADLLNLIGSHLALLVLIYFPSQVDLLDKPFGSFVTIRLDPSRIVLRVSKSFYIVRSFNLGISRFMDRLVVA